MLLLGFTGVQTYSLILLITGSAGMRFTAGTRIEARQYPLDRLIELIETGRLSVAVVP